MRKNKLMTRVFAGMMVTALVLQSTPMAPVSTQAAQKKVVIKTQKQLDAALKNKNVTAIEIRTTSGTTFSIKRGDYNKSIVVNSTKAKVVNNGEFKSVTVKNATSFTEKADNNKINVTDKNLNLTVSKGADNSKITVSSTGGKVNVKADGKVATVTVNKKTTLKVSGSTPNAVKITSNATGASINVASKANVQLNKSSVLNVTKGGQIVVVNAKANANVNVAEGAKVTNVNTYGEDSKVNVKADGTVAKVNVNKKATVNVKGDTDTAVKVTSKAEDATFVIDAKSDLVLTESANVTVTEGTVIGTLVANKDADIKVAEGATVEKVEVKGTDAKVNLEANGTVGAVSVDAKADVAVTGSTTSTVKVEANTEGASITTSVKTEVKANANVDVTVEKGAEGSKVTAGKEDVKTNVSNKSEQPVTITDSKGTETKVEVGESTKPETPTEPEKPVTPPGGGGSIGGGSSSGGGSQTQVTKVAVTKVEATSENTVTVTLEKAVKDVKVTLNNVEGTTTDEGKTYTITLSESLVNKTTYTVTLSKTDYSFTGEKSFTYYTADQKAVNAVAAAIKVADYTNIGYDGAQSEEASTKLAALQEKVNALKGETEATVTTTDIAGQYKVTITKNQASQEITISATFANTNTDQGKIDADTAALTWTTIKKENTSANEVTGDLTLPTEGANGTTIAWTSDKKEVIDTNGTVTRPESNQEDVEVTLTATISYTAAPAQNISQASALNVVQVANTTTSTETTSKTKTFTVTVKRKDVTKPKIDSDLSESGETKKIGETVTALSVTASGAVEGHETLSYQWYKATSAEGEGTVINGATEASYTPEATVDTLGTNYYYVVVTNTANGTDRTATIKSKVTPITVSKKDAPAAPDNDVEAVNDGVQTTSVTLKPIEVGDSVIEYAVAENNTAPTTEWQTSNVFTSLKPSTTYYFFARVQETEDTYAGTAKASAEITTKDVAITTVTITGDAKVGATLTASTDGTGTLTYQWKRSTETGYEDIGEATNSTYKVTPADLGKTIKVVIGTKESAPTATVAVGTLKVTAAPTVKDGAVKEVGTDLSSIELTTGTVQDASGTEIAGTFALVTEESEKVSATKEYSYKFTPSSDASAYDTENLTYDSDVLNKVKITAKAKVPTDLPSIVTENVTYGMIKFNKADDTLEYVKVADNTSLTGNETWTPVTEDEFAATAGEDIYFRTKATDKVQASDASSVVDVTSVGTTKNNTLTAPTLSTPSILIDSTGKKLTFTLTDSANDTTAKSNIDNYKVNIKVDGTKVSEVTVTADKLGTPFTTEALTAISEKDLNGIIAGAANVTATVQAIATTTSTYNDSAESTPETVTVKQQLATPTLSGVSLELDSAGTTGKLNYTITDATNTANISGYEITLSTGSNETLKKQVVTIGQITSGVAGSKEAISLSDFAVTPESTVTATVKAIATESTSAVDSEASDSQQVTVKQQLAAPALSDVTLVLDYKNSTTGLLVYKITEPKDTANVEKYEITLTSGTKTHKVTISQEDANKRPFVSIEAFDKDFTVAAGNEVTAKVQAIAKAGSAISNSEEVSATGNVSVKERLATPVIVPSDEKAATLTVDGNGAPTLKLALTTEVENAGSFDVTIMDESYNVVATKNVTGLTTSTLTEVTGFEFKDSVQSLTSNGQYYIVVMAHPASENNYYSSNESTSVTVQATAAQGGQE